jgi:hypothetical protein
MAVTLLRGNKVTKVNPSQIGFGLPLKGTHAMWVNRLQLRSNGSLSFSNLMVEKSFLIVAKPFFNYNSMIKFF